MTPSQVTDTQKKILLGLANRPGSHYSTIVERKHSARNVYVSGTREENACISLSREGFLSLSEQRVYRERERGVTKEYREAAWQITDKGISFARLLRLG